MKRKKIVIALFSIILLVGCGNSKTNDNNAQNVEQTQNNNQSNKKANLQKQFELPEKGEEVGIIHIKNYGDVHVKFFKEVAPKAVENFVTHAKNGYYDGLKFHRIINDFVIQGGDPKGNGTGGKSIWNKPFEDEFPPTDNPMPLVYNGALAMANSGPNTNGSQFFIVNAPFDQRVLDNMRGVNEDIINIYKLHGGTPHLFYKHTVFGQVYKGLDIVRNIMDDSAKSKLGDVIMEKIEITEYKGK